MNSFGKFFFDMSKNKNTEIKTGCGRFIKQRQMNASCSEDKHLHTPAHTQAAAGQVLGRRRISETFSCRLPAGADEDEGAAVTFRRFIWWPRYVFLRLSDQHRREENTVDVNIVLIYRHRVAPQNRRHFKLLLRILKRRPAGPDRLCSVMFCLFLHVNKSSYFWCGLNPHDDR